MDKVKLGKIVYGETASLRPQPKQGPAHPDDPAAWDPASKKALHNARVMIARIADARNGNGVAKPQEPGNDPLSQTVWKACKAAAEEGVGIDPETCLHFVIWPSDDGLNPTEEPKMSARWPYEWKASIKYRYGPFISRYSDSPKKALFYVLVYCGVPLLFNSDEVTDRAERPAK